MVHNWQIHEKKALNPRVLELACRDSLVARLLSNRNIDDLDTARYFLDLDSLEETSPLEIPEIEKAFERIQKAIKSSEKITIFGDYDVDGTSSAALMIRALMILGLEFSKQADYYIPNRSSEGYGLNKDAVQKIKDSGSSLLITCDCGISNFEEVEFANSIGLDVIITDHHSIPENPPASIANCNPKTLDENHPLHHLPGVGVAYKLAELLIKHYIGTALDPASARDYIESLQDLVALGMIADLAALKGENRLLVHRGLKVLAKTEKPGLRELLRVSGVKQDPNTEHIGFGLAPRINAAGRLRDAKLAVELMLEENILKARELAEKLDQENQERQKLCSETYDEALELVYETHNLENDKCIAIAKAGWNHGIIGIVASRLVDKFHLPVFIMAIEEKITKGSARGINLAGKLDLFKEMQVIQKETSIFEKYGGHVAAAGFSAPVEQTEELCKKLKEHFQARLSDLNLDKTIMIDTALKLREVNKDLLDRIAMLAPYGIENPNALFISGPLRLKGMRSLGKEEKHLKLFLEDETTSHPVEAVIWNRAEEFMDYFPQGRGSEITIVYSPKMNEFNGESFLQLDIKDFKKPSEVDGTLFERFKAPTAAV